MSSQSRNNRIKRLLMSSDTEVASESTTSSNSPKKHGPKKRKSNGDGKVFIVERILKYKQWKGVRYARVKWLGYQETTWEPANAIFDFTPAVATEMKPQGKKVAESLVGRRKIKGNVEYKVHWKGLPSIFDKWIRESTLKRPDLVEAFVNNDKKSVKTLRLIPSTTQVQKRKTPEGKRKSTPPTEEDRGEEFGIPEALPIITADDVSSPPHDPSESSVEEDSSNEVKHFPAPLPASLTKSPLMVKIPKRTMKNRDVRSPSTDSLKSLSLSQYAILTDSQGNKYRFIDDKPMREWSVNETYEYILQRGFPEVATVAQSKEVTGAQLLGHLDPAALKELLTIPLGPSFKLVKLLKDLKTTKPNIQVTEVEPVASDSVESSEETRR
ncbi:hypothetical protein RvY_01503 [Ramazzottius varieornatus]|uniref:Chromo domain-containing protein n=1 Tax=Ramazzottius varieornatus TaxID=947166 RepID=A0A1D1UKF4_RAMVA|nr:hypothetical protein RvY_01503 [Ramazzottius varieornatus]